MQLVDFWVLYFKDTYQIYFNPQNPQVRVHYKKKINLILISFFPPLKPISKSIYILAKLKIYSWGQGKEQK